MKKDKRQDIDTLEEEFSIKDFLILCLAQWKWFLASLICFAVLGAFYIARKAPVYERSMEVLIKDQEGGGGVADITNAFSSLGLVSNNTSVYNELISLTSPAVIFDVVERLDLTMNYNLKHGLHPNVLYGSNNPINVSFVDLDKQSSVSFKMRLYADGRYNIFETVKYDNEGKKHKEKADISGKLTSGATMKTPLGAVKITPNDAYVGGVDFEDEDGVVIEIWHQGLQLTVERYHDLLKGDLTDQDAEVIKLSLEDPSVERADDILEAVVEVYNQRWIEDKNRVAVATSQFISDRLNVIQSELGNVDSEIADYKSSMKLPEVKAATYYLMEHDFVMKDEIMKASNQLAMTGFLKEYMQNPANAYSIIPMNTGTENSVLENQISKYNELLLQRNNLAENSSDQNPLVKDMNKQLTGMRSSIMHSINGHISNLENTLKNMTRERNTDQSELSSTPKRTVGLLSAERQQIVMEQLYLFLLQKREENELSQKFTADNTRIITPPYGNHSPVSPKKKLIMLIAIVLGLGIPAVALFLAESSNTKIRSRKDVESLSVPFAGEIPFIGKKRRLSKMLKSKKKKLREIDKPRMVVREGLRDIPNEAFRVVRSNIDFMLKKGEKTVIALTSLNPGSGKSFVAYNLGASFALKGKKVLIIDGDLRHGSISTYVDSPKRGLTNYLNGSIEDWKSVVKKTEVEGLYVLPIGQRPPNPAELLDNGKLEPMLEEAKQDYDIVLFDCPPVNIVVDTQIINQFVQRTLFVVRAGLLEKKAIGDIQKLVEEEKLKNVTLLLNGTETAFSSYHSYGNYEAIDKM